MEQNLEGQSTGTWQWLKYAVFAIVIVLMVSLLLNFIAVYDLANANISTEQNLDDPLPTTANRKQPATHRSQISYRDVQQPSRKKRSIFEDSNPEEIFSKLMLKKLLLPPITHHRIIPSLKYIKAEITHNPHQLNAIGKNRRFICNKYFECYQTAPEVYPKHPREYYFCGESHCFPAT